MTWLAFAFALQVGMIPQGSFTMIYYDLKPAYDVQFAQNTSAAIYFTDLRAELIFFEPFSLFMGGETRIQMGPWPGGFNPQSIFYQFNAGIRYKGLELYYLHACRHPQMANAYMYNVISGWDSAYDEIGIKFSGKVDLIKTKKKE